MFQQIELEMNLLCLSLEKHYYSIDNCQEKRKERIHKYLLYPKMTRVNKANALEQVENLMHELEND